MNILFITLVTMDYLRPGALYGDLCAELASREGIRVFVACPLERREGRKTQAFQENGIEFLRVQTLNNTKVGPIEKAAALLTTPRRLAKAVRRHFRAIRFDLILFSTPPISFCDTAQALRGDAKVYLMLKDIWPQTGVDLGAFKKNSLPFRYFAAKERRAYALSDYIGCMSRKNADIVAAHYPQYADKLEVLPNAIAPRDLPPPDIEETRREYGIPMDALLLVYGGSLGKPQGVDFMMRAMEAAARDENVYILIAGAGTEYPRIEAWAQSMPRISLRPFMEKNDYMRLLQAADAGLIFLDYHFTVPNIPSRMLDYMQAALPVIASTDPVTDVGDIIQEGGFGLHCLSNDTAAFKKCVEVLRDAGLRRTMGKKGRAYLEDNWTARHAADSILKHFMDEDSI